MVAVTCKLKFADGLEVTGTILGARYHSDECPVKYTGPVERLHNVFEIASPSFLRVLFQNAAARTGAVLDVQQEGVYDIPPCSC
jgi:hypothetical protein